MPHCLCDLYNSSPVCWFYLWTVVFSSIKSKKYLSLTSVFQGDKKENVNHQPDYTPYNYSIEACLNVKCITFKHAYQIKNFGLQKSLGSRLVEPTCSSSNYKWKANENEICLSWVLGLVICNFVLTILRLICIILYTGSLQKWVQVSCTLIGFPEGERSHCVKHLTLDDECQLIK